MKQNNKIKFLVLGCFVFGLLSFAVFANPAKVFAGCHDNTECQPGEVCNTYTAQCISDPKGLCAAHTFPCAYGCNPDTGACLTSSGGALPTRGVQGTACAADSDCQIGLSCDLTMTPHTCQVPPGPPIPGSAPVSTYTLPSFLNPTLTAPACYQGTCPTGLCSTNGVCLPPSQYTTGIAASTSLSDFILKLVKILLTFAGMIAVVMLVIGGYWYMAAGGNEEMSEKGKKTILNFVMGLVIIVLAYTIVSIIASTLTGADRLLQ